MSESPSQVRYLDLDDLLDVITFATGAGPAIRDLGLLESALHRPAASAFGEDAYPDLFVKAAALTDSLIRNHGLIDGNKRTGWLACWLFLRLNGRRLGGPTDDAFDLVIAIAEGRIELDQIAEKLAQWSGPAVD